MRSHLKVKVFTLAAEMTYIRRQEEKWKNRARYARSKVRDTTYQDNAFWSHRYHRVGLKEDARSSHLAYGCMRGVPYSRMEGMCYGPLKGYGSSEPDWKSIEGMVERFSKDETSPQVFMQSYSEWVEAAKVWYEGNTERIKAWQEQRSQEQLARLANPEYQKLHAAYKEEMQQRFQKK